MGYVLTQISYWSLLQDEKIPVLFNRVLCLCKSIALLLFLRLPYDAIVLAIRIIV